MNKITQEEFIIQMLPLVMQMDRRLMVHSFYDVDGIWKHTERCPKCCALRILNIESDMEIELSTGEELQKN